MIEIKDLQASYEGFEKNQILNIKNAVFEEGVISGIVGLNGSGKSTLLRTILGMTSVMSGTLLIDGKPLGSFGHKKRAREIAYLPQSYTAANMDLFTLVSHGRFPYLGFSKVLGKKDLELIENALRLTDLWQIKDKNLSEISGGQRQRAYLAMAIAQNTKYLLLDEVAASLDIKHQIEILEVLKKLAAEGKGIIITSHDLPQSFTVCQKIFLMEKGKIIAEGNPAQLAAGTELRQSMGIGLKNCSDQDSLYKYNLIKA